MARRRGAPSINSLSPPESGAPAAAQSTGFLNFPRSASPSTGFTGFLSKPTKWFNRSHSSNAVSGRSSTSSTEPRPSTSSSIRKPKISHPTDPRPILDSLRPEPSYGAQGASRSVFDLSLARTPTTYDQSPPLPSTRTPSSPSHPGFSKGLGDLRSISRKPWSKSADDLGKISHTTPAFSPIDTSFAGKIEQYRSNRNDSLGSNELPSPSAASLKHVPFPTITTSDNLSSSPPPRLTASASSSSPVSTSSPPLTPTSGQVHARSHSFTPRLPSKFTGPKLANLVPPSPKRKGSASSEHASISDKKEADRDRAASGGSTASARSAFPFNFSPSVGDKLSASPGLLAPPTIIEPDVNDDPKNQKRTSQVVYHSGFINRLSDFSPAVMQARANHSYMSGTCAPSLAKGWKPFKLVLKGSKLYFYKPPSDRSNAVRDLFPTELVVVLEEEGIGKEENGSSSPTAELEDTTRVGKVKEREESRKRRAYWGRGTHPNLVVGESVERGTFEALLHEAVFATTFHREDPASSDDSDSSVHHLPDWKEFASTVLLALPSIVERTRFETEFFRCSRLLVDGSEDSLKAEEVGRVQWLANQYLEYYGSPAVETAWKDWWTKTMPAIPFVPKSLHGVTKSSSIQALYTPSPDPSSSPSKKSTEFSPNLGTFSPRPEFDGRMLSLLDVLNERRADPTTLSTKPDQTPLRSVLPHSGLSRDILVGLDPQVVARSLYIFHRRLLQEHIPENVTADVCFEQASREALSSDNSRDAQAARTPTSSPLKFFTGTEEQLHWLTKTILLQILISDTPGRIPNSSSLTGPRLSEERTALTSRTHSRSEVISAWARIGELCRRTGDECSWRAIYTALCSRPIARLDKVWKRVDGDALKVVQSWVYGHDGEAPLRVAESKTIPWASDSLSAIKIATDEAYSAEENEWKVFPLTQARRAFEELRKDIEGVLKASPMSASESDDVEALAAYYQHMAEGNGTSGLASKFTRVDQFMTLSLAAEPRRKGLFEPYFWSRPTVHHGFHPLTPLLFPEPLPSIAFLDRSLLARSRVESNASMVNTKDIHYLRELSALSGESRSRHEAAKMNGLDLKGTVIVLFDGELTLLVQPGNDHIPPSQPSSRAPSRPPSGVADTTNADKSFGRAPSIRVKPGSRGLERKPSQLRRSSLPSLSKKPSFMTVDVSSDRPLRVVVQAGTLDRLVDVLIEGLHGISVSVADDNGEMPLDDRKTREVRVDLDEYSTVWWSTFRSFVTPLVFFELLRKRFLAGGVNGEAPSPENISLIVRTRSQIFDAITRWLTAGGGAQDVLDDSVLCPSLLDFLKKPIQLPADNSDDSITHGLSLLDDMRKELLTMYATQTLRPLPRTNVITNEGPQRSMTQSFGSEPPDVNTLDAEELVNNLDAMAAAAFRNVVQEDLFIAADILEVQSADRTGWFPAREPPSISDEVEIQCIHSYLHDVEPSAMISELGQDSLYRLLPPAVRGCIRAFGILRKWLISKVAESRISLQTRQSRMELLLRAIEVCRLRSTDILVPEQGLADRPCVRSFVEAVVTSAVLSVESRMYHRAWQLVASARSASYDSIASLVNRPTVKAISTRSPLTMDIGWVLEKILEVISMPDILEAASLESLNLVNFDKRRALHGVIVNAVPPGLPTKAHHRYESCRQDFERLNNIEQLLSSVHFDHRSIREGAHREATQAITSTSLPRKIYRPFHALVLAQQEKNKKDKTLRDRLSKEKRQEQQRQDKRDEYLNKAMHHRRPPTSTSKQHRNKKSVSSAFMQLMRPISSAFISESTFSTGPKRTPAELDFVPSNKPALVLNVVDARVHQFINAERSFTFQLDTEDGGHYLLQAMDKQDMKKWIDTIERVSKNAAQRRLTYLGHNSKMQMSDHLVSPGSVSRDPRAVFGVDLDCILRREAQGEDVQPGCIPFVIERLLAEVDSRGLTEIGIYRVAGAHSEVNTLKEALNRGEWPIDKYTDINAVCDLIKSWFRVLPSGMFPAEHFGDIIGVAANGSLNLDVKLGNLRRVVHSLPRSRFDILKRLMEHLDRVTDFEEQNQMTADSLATVFSPNLLRSSNDDIGFFFANMSAAHRAVKLLITHFHTIFDDAEPDGDGEQDDSSDVEHFEQFDEPIPEEDEEDDDLLSASHALSEAEDETSRNASFADLHSEIARAAL